MPLPLLKFLATPPPSLVVDEQNVVIGFGPPYFRNASPIAGLITTHVSTTQQRIPCVPYARTSLEHPSIHAKNSYLLELLRAGFRQ